MEKEIRFRPITNGLGFHPFSDGLPYAPVNKNPAPRYDRGTGAYAAGPQLPVLKPIPIAAPTSAQVSARLPAPAATRIWTEPPAVYGLGYPIRRACAYLLDSVLNIGLCSVALGFSLWKQQIHREILLTPGIFMLAILFLAGLNWALITAQEVAFGTSFGKRLFGLVVHGSTSMIFIRALLFVPSFCFFGIGLIWSLFDRNKRCWHDLVVNLQPTFIAQL